jgi:DNA-binding NarL/FixJ family response regulator
MAIIRVLIADDHPIVRDGIRAALATHDEITIVASASSFDEVADGMATTPVDVVVLDLNEMQGSPFTMVQRLQRDYPNTQIVIFSSTVELAPELLRAGVHGYVIKEELSSHLVIAVEQVSKGKHYLSPLVQEYVERSQNQRRQYGLAPKELNTVMLIAQGFKTEEIAAQMGIDPRTVQNYVSSAMRKTGCSNRVQLADWYRRTYDDT